MADMLRQANETDFTFRLGEAAADDWLVTGFSGREGMSELYRFRIELCCDESREPDLDAQVGQACTLEIAGRHTRRYVSGIVRRFERTGQGAHRLHYAAEIVPLHWLLTKRRRSRVFQEPRQADMSVPGIIASVFASAGLAADSYRFALGQDYEPRDFVVQYRESDMDFVSRLMVQEGLYYFFEHSAGGHVMVVTDGSVAHTGLDGLAEMPYRDVNGLNEEAEVVYRLKDQASVQLGAVTLDDFNFRRPAAQLRTGLAAERFAALEEVDYPGEYEERAIGSRYAQLRLEAQQARRRSVRLATAVRGMTPGYRFTLAEHPCANANREYLITRVEHRGAQSQSGEEESLASRPSHHRSRVWAIPAEIPFRAAPRTRRPTVRGSQTAIVVGPAGEEIHTDEYGRIRVQFHWDQEGGYDEDSSCWIRVSQSWAGGNYGVFFLPRIGQEVIVDFLEGNPDRPIVTGSVYNNDNMPPYRLPDHKTRSVIKSNSSKGGGGTNEIRFEDAQDAEQLFLHAARDLHTRAGNDRVQSIGRDDHLMVERHKYELVKQSRHAEVRLDLKEKVGGGKYLEVAGHVAEEFKGNHYEHVNGKLTFKAEDKLVIESAAGICLKVGGNFITIDSTGIYVMGTVVHLNSQGSALNGTSVALQDVESPLEADKAEPGSDASYAADPYEYASVDAATSANGDGDDDEQETSWIEIELVDEAGQPWPNEPYEVIEPDGTVKRGSLDANGQAHVAVSDPGECQISFPNLDRRAWERT